MQKPLAHPPGSCGAGGASSAGGGLHGCAGAGRAALGDGKRASGLASARAGCVTDTPEVLKEVDTA